MNKVAVYGSLRDGMSNHVLLEHVEGYSRGEVAGFDMYSLGGFPAIVKGKGTVQVEVYEVDDLTFEQLDTLEGYYSSEDYWYNRERVTVQLEDGSEVESWIYFFDEVPNGLEVPDGDWRNYVICTRNDYY